MDLSCLIMTMRGSRTKKKIKMSIVFVVQKRQTIVQSGSCRMRFLNLRLNLMKLLSH